MPRYQTPGGVLYEVADAENLVAMQIGRPPKPESDPTFLAHAIARLERGYLQLEEELAHERGYGQLLNEMLAEEQHRRRAAEVLADKGAALLREAEVCLGACVRDHGGHFHP